MCLRFQKAQLLGTADLCLERESVLDQRWPLRFRGQRITPFFGPSFTAYSLGFM